MISFAWWYVFLCLPAPILVRRLSGTRGGETSAAIKVPFFRQIKTLNRQTAAVGGVKGAPLLWVLWVLLVTALARPQMPDKIQNYTVPVRDVMLIVDISRSMLRADAGEGMTRLDAAKSAAIDFVKRRKNDRVGVVLFSEQVNLYVPLTVDARAVEKMLSAARTGWLGSLTAIGDATGLALKHLKQSDAPRKVIVLLTDGVNNAGNLAPDDALIAARQNGVTFYTVGVGEGENVDADFLARAAQQTGGLFFMARNAAGVQAAYDRISENEPLSAADVYLMRKKELYRFPLTLFALIASCVVFKRAVGCAAFGGGGDD